MGITGHQRLAQSDTWTWVAKAVEEQLALITRPIIGVTSLAIGADQLVARCVLDRGGQIHAVLPFADIERSFSPDTLPSYWELVSRASSVEIIPPCETDEDAYLAAGERVVDLSEIVIAVWDGMPARGKGGTADTVRYAKFRGLPIVHINTLCRIVDRARVPKSWL